AERLLEEALGGLDIARWIFDIVDLFVQRHAGVLRLADDGSQPSSGCLCEGIARRWIRGPAAMARHESPGRRDQSCSAQRSYSSASTTRTRTLSPGCRPVPAMNTLPSISGAS